jgi:hypothetical protein
VTYSIHGLEMTLEHSSETSSGAFCTTVLEYGYTRFSDGRWMVTLPDGVGLGDSFESALEDAQAQQHAALWGVP